MYLLLSASFRLAFKVGDTVVLSSNMEYVKSTFSNTPFTWNALMVGMLGKLYEVLDVKSTSVALPSPDGSYNGKWYFPNAVISLLGINFGYILVYVYYCNNMLY